MQKPTAISSQFCCQLVSVTSLRSQKRANGIFRTPHQTGECGTRPFLRWVQAKGRSPDTQTHPEKYIRPHRHSAIKERFRRQAINLAPPRRVRAWGDGLLRLEECQSWPRDANVRPPRHLRQAASADYCIQRHDTPDQIHAADNTAG